MIWSTQILNKTQSVVYSVAGDTVRQIHNSMPYYIIPPLTLKKLLVVSTTIVASIKKGVNHRLLLLLYIL